MSNGKLKICIVVMASWGLMLATSSAFSAEKRCKAGGKKVECPTQSDADLKKAAAAYEKEAHDMAAGKAGSTYGIAPFDYLTGVGKRTAKATLTSGDSGYGSGTGKTELWDRVKNPTKGEALYNQWTNNWSPTFNVTHVPGADPNAGKQWYYFYCTACHGWMLQGNGPTAIELDPRPRTLTAGKYMNQKTNLELFVVIKGGGEAVSLSGSMPSWGNYLMDQDIWNIVAWIRAMQDVGAPKSIKEYLNPKSTFKPIKGDVNPLNAMNDDEFIDAQELMEAELSGRDGAGLVGAGFVEGGLRKAPKDVAQKVKGGY